MMKQKRIRRTMLSLLLILSMLCNFRATPVAAADPEVTIRNLYDNFQRVQKIVEINDTSMSGYKTIKMNVKPKDGSVQLDLPVKVISSSRIEANLNKDWDVEYIVIRLSNSTTGLLDKDIEFNNINENGIPEITSIQTPVVQQGQDILVSGATNLNELAGTDYELSVGQKTATAIAVAGNNQQVKLQPQQSGESFQAGANNITVTLRGNNGSFSLENKFVYTSAVNVFAPINLKDITMFPTMGEPGSKVSFIRENLEKDWDIYFIRDLNDPSLFNEKNLAKNFTANINPDKADVITATVPEVNTGFYHIVFTNKNSLTEGIKARATLEGQQYTVIHVSQQPFILDNITPNNAPCQTATDVTINGNYFAPHNITGFVPASGSGYPKLEPISGGVAVIDYGPGILNINGKPYNVNLKRTLTVDIGGPVNITEAILDFNDENNLNDFKVKTATFQIDEAKTEDVKIIMDTQITGEFVNSMPKEIVLPQAFTYLPSTEKPVLNSVTPGLIPVKKSGSNYFINVNPGMDRNELQISLKGQKFLVTRYKDAGGVEHPRYPIIKMGGITINYNDGAPSSDYRPEKMEVLSGDKTVDGTDKNQIGDTILIWLKTGISGVQVLSKADRGVTIQNPIRQSNTFSGIYSFPGMVTFSEIGDNDFPVIDNVNPSLVSVDGGEDVVITGSNLQVGAKVYIDGKELPASSYKVSGDNKLISLKTPKGSPGSTLIQVQNPIDQNNTGGGIASHPFLYTTTYTDPKLFSINPKEGSARTIVTAKGENFLRPDPTVLVESIPANEADDIVMDENLVYRLIGSRILMDGYDINEYYKVGGRIALTPYVNGVQGRTLQENIFEYRSGYDLVELGNGFNSVIFLDRTNKKFYGIVRDVKNQLWIEDGLGVKYSIIYDKGSTSFKAINNGVSYNLAMDVKGKLTIGTANPITLTAYTPFKINNNIVTGNRVKFVDLKTLTFEVPVLANTPWTGDADLYDVTVINPDTKRATLQKAFRYFTNPMIIPVVTDVVPDQGPDQGGNRITIYGLVDSDIHTGFVNNGGSKTRVFFGNQEALPADILVSVDGSQMTLNVPKYLESIKDKGTDRVTVPIVLVNPDGGAFSISIDRPLAVASKKILGYSYVVPTSSPRISELGQAQGSGNGGYEIEVFGSDFRFEEPFIDQDGNGKYDSGESFTDIDGDGTYSVADLTQKRASVYSADMQCLSSTLLPKIYVGTKEAEITKITPLSMMIIVPPGKGTADVYVVNNDCGISNKVKFTYLSSAPKINSIIPDSGKKQGGDKVEIIGEGFEKSKVNFLDSNSNIQSGDLGMVRFANRTNKDLPREDANSGVVKASPTIVKLAGNLQISFDGDNKLLELSITQSGKKYSKSFSWDGKKSVFINTKELRLLPQDEFPYEELISCELEEKSGSYRLLVEAGYAPEVDYVDAGHLIVTTPGYFTVGQVGLTVINPDGGKAEGKFEYKNPASHPKITNILKDSSNPQEAVKDGEIDKVLVQQMNYKGNSVITILGEDFGTNAKIQIGDLLTIQPADINYSLPNKLSFTMPVVDDKKVFDQNEKGYYYRVVVVNEDGGVACSDVMPSGQEKIYIQFTKGQSDPEVKTVTPAIGPVSGGTVVLIDGSEFRDNDTEFPRAISVYFGDQKASIVEMQKNLKSKINGKEELVDRLRVISPAGTIGVQQVRVENPDGSIALSTSSFTYISTPQIISVVNPDDPTENQRIREISIEGEQVIKIKGSGFMAGAKVVFAPETETVTGGAVSAGGTHIYRVGQQIVSGLSSSVVQIENLKSGSEGGDTKFIDAETLTVKVPTGQLDTKGIIVVNPDQGASPSYDELTYKLPGIEAPAGVIAEVVHDQYGNTDRYIKVYWQPVQKASQYDTYVSVDGGAFKFIGATKLTAFLYKDLKERTRYRFMIKSIGNFGSSPPSMTSNEVSTGRTVGAPDTDGKLHEKTQQSRSGNTAMVSIGTDDYNKQISTVDLTRGTLAGCKELVLTMPAEVVSSSRAQDIQILGSDFSLTINPNAFNIGVLKQTNGKNAGVRFKISPATKQALSGSSAAMSTIYQLEASAFVGSESTGIDYLALDAAIAIDENSSKMALWRIQNPALYRYDVTNRKWDTSYNWSSVGTGGLATINRLGYYTVMGTRR